MDYPSSPFGADSAAEPSIAIQQAVYVGTFLVAALLAGGLAITLGTAIYNRSFT